MVLVAAMSPERSRKSANVGSGVAIGWAHHLARSSLSPFVANVGNPSAVLRLLTDGMGLHVWDGTEDGTISEGEGRS